MLEYKLMGMKTVQGKAFTVFDEDGEIRGRYTDVAQCARDWFPHPSEEYAHHAYLNDADKEELEEKIRKWENRTRGYFSVLRCLNHKQKTFSDFKLFAKYDAEGIDK